MKNYNGLFYGNKKGYELGKENAREFAINFQQDASNENYSLDYFAEQESKLIKLGKRYGLLKEFKENGIL